MSIAVLAHGCSPESPSAPPASVATLLLPAPSAPTRTLAWAQDDHGSWIEEMHDVTTSDVVGNYVMTDLGMTTRILLLGGGRFVRTSSGCVGTPYTSSGSWRIEENGIRLMPAS